MVVMMVMINYYDDDVNGKFDNNNHQDRHFHPHWYNWTLAQEFCCQPIKPGEQCQGGLAGEIIITIIMIIIMIMIIILIPKVELEPRSKEKSREQRQTGWN